MLALFGLIVLAIAVGNLFGGPGLLVLAIVALALHAWAND